VLKNQLSIAVGSFASNTTALGITLKPLDHLLYLRFAWKVLSPPFSPERERENKKQRVLKNVHLAIPLV